MKIHKYMLNVADVQTIEACRVESPNLDDKAQQDLDHLLAATELPDLKLCCQRVSQWVENGRVSAALRTKALAALRVREAEYLRRK